MLQHDNTLSHTSRTIAEALVQLKFEPIPHLPYSPDLVLCDFHFSFHLKTAIKGIHFTTDNEVKDAVKSGIKEKPLDLSLIG